MCRQNVLRLTFRRCPGLPLPRKTKERLCFPPTKPLSLHCRSSLMVTVLIWLVFDSSTVTVLSWICQQRRSRISSIRDPVSTQRSNISLSRVPSRDLIRPKRSSGMYSALTFIPFLQFPSRRCSARNELLLSGCEEFRTIVRGSRLYCSTKKGGCQAARGRTPNCHDTDRAPPPLIIIEHLF